MKVTQTFDLNSRHTNAGENRHRQTVKRYIKRHHLFYLMSTCILSSVEEAGRVFVLLWRCRTLCLLVLRGEGSETSGAITCQTHGVVDISDSFVDETNFEKAIRLEPHIVVFYCHGWTPGRSNILRRVRPRYCAGRSEKSKALWPAINVDCHHGCLKTTNLVDVHDKPGKTWSLALLFVDNRDVLVLNGPTPCQGWRHIVRGPRMRSVEYQQDTSDNGKFCSSNYCRRTVRVILLVLKHTRNTTKHVILEWNK